MAKWFYGLATPATGTAHAPQVPGGVFMELPSARSRSLSLRCDPAASDEAAFTLSGSAPEGAFIGELDTDLVVQRDDETLFRGRIGPTGDSLDAIRHDAQFTALSYRELLRRRALLTAGTLSFTTVDQALIVWSMMDYTQGLPGGYLGIGRGAGAAGGGSDRTVTYQKTDYIYDNIVALAQMDNGFDWNVTCEEGPADLRLDIFPGGLLEDHGVILEWGDNQVGKVTRSFDPSTYADVLYLTGASSAGLTPVTVTKAGIATLPEGRWESVVSTSEVIQLALNLRGTFLANDVMRLLATYTVELKPGAWKGPDHIWPGDQLRFRLRTTRLDVNLLYKVTQLDIALGDAGDERVTLTLGRLPPSLKRMIRTVQLKAGLNGWQLGGPPIR